VSDAGLPGVNDPGARLIAAAIAEAVPVTVLPGPSAVETALVASGLVGERYQFLGYLPRRDSERRALWRELERWPHAVVAFESPRRLPGSLAGLASAMPERLAAVARELTKRYEEVARGTLSELAQRFREPPRGEITVVLGETDVRPTAGAGEATDALAELVAAGLPRRQAAALVARLTGTSANALYRSSIDGS
jgi:16S rRNA (cytidine1402-2'-O)-methyltransferase